VACGGRLADGVEAVDGVGVTPGVRGVGGASRCWRSSDSRGPRWTWPSLGSCPTVLSGGDSVRACGAGSGGGRRGASSWGALVGRRASIQACTRAARLLRLACGPALNGASHRRPAVSTRPAAAARPSRFMTRTQKEKGGVRDALEGSTFETVKIEIHTHTNAPRAMLPRAPQTESLSARQNALGNYTRCGILAHGLLRLGCDIWQQEGLQQGLGPSYVELLGQVHEIIGRHGK
jgi:hypothetical protein